MQWFGRNQRGKQPHLRTIETDHHTFKRHLQSVDRFYDGEKGVVMQRASRLEGFDPHVIFVREDGWKICCNAEDTESTYWFWPQEWKKMIVKMPGMPRVEPST